MRYTQPQSGPAQIDWSNPITRGLVFCVPGTPGNYDDIAGRKKATASSALGQKVNANGSFGAFNGAQNIDYPVFGAELPASGPATIAFIDQAIAPAGYGTTLDFMPFGGASEVLIYQGASPYGLVAGPRGATGFLPEFTASVGVPTDGVNRRMIVRCSTTLNSAAVADWNVFVGSSKFTTTTSSGISNGTASVNRWGALSSGADFWDGVIGQMCIWNRALTDAEAKSYNENPWQLFKSPQRVMLAAATAAPTGTLAAQNAADAVVAAGSTTIVGSLARSNVGDTAAASGTTTVRGAVAYANASDAGAASGVAGAVTGAVTYTNDGDLATASGSGGLAVASTGGGFEMVSLEPSWKRALRVRAERAEKAQRVELTRKQRKRAEFLEKLAAKEAASAKPDAQIDARLSSLLAEWIALAPMIDLTPVAQVSHADAYRAFMDRVAGQALRLKHEDEDDESAAEMLLLM